MGGNSRDWIPVFLGREKQMTVTLASRDTTKGENKDLDPFLRNNTLHLVLLKTLAAISHIVTQDPDCNGIR